MRTVCTKAVEREQEVEEGSFFPYLCACRDGGGKSMSHRVRRKADWNNSAIIIIRRWRGERATATTTTTTTGFVYTLTLHSAVPVPPATVFPLIKLVYRVPVIHYVSGTSKMFWIMSFFKITNLFWLNRKVFRRLTYMYVLLAVSSINIL